MHLKAKKQFKIEKRDNRVKTDPKLFNGIIKEKVKPIKFPTRIEILFCKANLLVRSTML